MIQTWRTCLPNHLLSLSQNHLHQMLEWALHIPHDARVTEVNPADVEVGGMNDKVSLGPIVNVIQATPWSSPINPSAQSTGFLDIPHAGVQASSETPSAVSSTSKSS